MKKFVFMTIAVIAVFSIALYIDAQPAGGGMGMGGGMGFGAGGGMGMGGGGQRGNRMVRPRPDKKERLAAVADLEKQIVALRAAIEKGPAKDPNLVDIEDADLTTFMDTFTVESNAINTIQATLTSLRGTGARGGRNAGPAENVLTELAGLAKDEEATKTAARIDALIQQAQERATRGGGRGAGGAGGMMGGGFGGRGGAN